MKNTKHTKNEDEYMHVTCISIIIAVYISMTHLPRDQFDVTVTVVD